MNSFIRIFKKIWRRTPLYHVSKTDNPVRWGIIGLGYMAETFATAIDGNHNGIVAAVASRSKEKALSFAKRHGHCHAYGSYSDMLNDRNLAIDVIYIATPASTHYQYVKMCLEAGKNVLCEKPITLSSDELHELMALARIKSCFLMEGMWMKCLPTFVKACQWIHEGRIGAIQLVRANIFKRELIRDGYSIYKSGEGGVIRDFGIYAISFMTHFLGGRPEIMEMHSRLSNRGIDTDWQIYGCRKDIQAYINLSSDFGCESKAVVIGTNGFIEWGSQFNRTNIIKIFNSKGVLEESFKANYHFDGFEYEVDEVQSGINSHMLESRLVPLDESLVAIDTLERIIFSS